MRKSVEIIGDLTIFVVGFRKGATIQDLVSDETINPQSHNLLAYLDIPGDDQSIGIHPSFPLENLSEEIFLLPSIIIVCDFGDGNVERKEVKFERWTTMRFILFDQGIKTKKK